VADPSVTIVVVTYNSADVLPGFFDALPAGLEGIEGEEVVVADNGSSDRSVEIARDRWPAATIVETGRNGGYAGGINDGVRAARPSPAVLVLNPDIRLGSHAVAALLDALDEEEVGIVVPRLVDGGGRLLKSLRREPSVGRALGEAVLGGRLAGRYSALGEVVEDEASYETSTEADWASGCAMLVSRACWDAIGPWDESFFLYAEDTEYALRARDRGFRLMIAPEAKAVHLVGPSHEDPRLWAMSVWNRYRLFRRRHGPVTSAAFRGSLVLNEAIRSLAGRRAHRAGLAALLRTSSRPEEVR
jgi:GT2 family glycosyltransferase